MKLSSEFCTYNQRKVAGKMKIPENFLCFFIVLLFICAFISPPGPHPLPYHPLHPLPLPPTSWTPGRNYFALISNFVEERV
jgi:hypothetical protein